MAKAINIGTAIGSIDLGDHHMTGQEIIAAAIDTDKPALINRLHLTSEQSKADALATSSKLARDAAMARYAAACNALDNVY
jgi:hypothetical protein